MSDLTNDTATTGSRLPAEIAFSGAQSGLGLKPDLEMIAGEAETALPPRPVRAKANDAAAVRGIVAEGNLSGDDIERKIPWL